MEHTDAKSENDLSLTLGIGTSQEAEHQPQEYFLQIHPTKGAANAHFYLK